MRPTVTIARNANGLHDLAVKGRFFHPHWVAHLFAGLFRQGVSIVSGRAGEGERFEWDARFSLDFRNSAAVPEKLDYVALAEKPMTVDLEKLGLSRYRITRRADRQLELELEGPDQIGFLGRMLMRLSMMMLFPSELDIKTVGGRIQDRLALRSLGGTEPAESTRQSLDEMLARIVSGG